MNSKIIYVIPLRPLSNSPIRDKALQLFNSTLNSVHGQSDDRWQVVVSASEPLHFRSDRVTLDTSILDLAIAEPSEVALTSDISQKRQDMHLKRKLGSGIALKMGASHVMFLDADDLIDRELTRLVLNAQVQDSFIADSGWEVLGNSNRVFLRKRKFASRCGSSVVLHKSLLCSSYFECTSQLDTYPYYHHHYVSAAASFKAKKLSQPTVAYRTEHEANVSLGMKNLQIESSRLKKISFILRLFVKYILSRPYDSTFVERFGPLVVPQSEEIATLP